VPLCAHTPEQSAPDLVESFQIQRKEMTMKAANILMISGALFAFSAGFVNAGPCTTPSRDAGSGKVPGYTGQTIGSAPAEAAPSEQSQKMTAGTPEQTQPAPNEQSQKMTAGADQPAPSEKKPASATEQGC
jgi:hypothetical protein